jgi:hypothetical protein
MRVLGPKQRGDPHIGWPCEECGQRFVLGDVTALVDERPADALEVARADQGLPYVSTGRELHAGCAANWIRKQRADRKPA